ncbi:MAG: hypothetical protein U9Q78_08330 [Chloroflexota bacterium]|nr:hypothetical protein [Chloroflexota bacterium]
MASGLTAVIMTGGGGQTQVEQLVSGAREAVTRDTVEKLLQVESIERVVVATDSPALASSLATCTRQGDGSVIVEVDSPIGRFHFGQRLSRIIADHEIERCLYIGGGSGPLLTVEGWGEIAAKLADVDDMVIANNLYSTDFAAWAPAAALGRVSLKTDNDLAWRLHFDAGLPARALPRSAATELDVDTPTDLMTLKLHPDCGPHTRQYLEGLKLDTSALEQVLDVLLDREAEVLVAGRVSAEAAAYLQAEALCRKRILAEERGMRASGRQARGEVRSLLGVLLDDRGPRGFFDTLSQIGDALILDSRVILAHRRSWPSAADRFHSDLRQPERMKAPCLREFTAAAIEASIPVVLGGHSLVSGGLWALVDAAWSRVEGEVPRLRVPLELRRNKLI